MARSAARVVVQHLATRGSDCWTAASRLASRCAVVFAFGCALERCGLAELTAQKVPTSNQEHIRAVFHAYANGDDLAVQRWLSTATGIGSIREIEAAIATGAPWDRNRAAFLLEVLVAEPIRALHLLVVGRSTVIGRPTPFGADPEEDRFEILWHQVALGVAQNYPHISFLREYVAALEVRLAKAAAPGTEVESRFALVRAATAAAECCASKAPGELVRHIPRAVRSEATIARALALFEVAAKQESLRGEALLRGGKLLYEAGHTAEALKWLTRVPPQADPALYYTHQLLLGRIFDKLDRDAEAATAYSNAFRLDPSAQRPAIGAAAALLRSGRVAEAASMADAASRVSGPRSEHSRRFTLEDGRFVKEWLAEIRKRRR